MSHVYPELRHVPRTTSSTSPHAPMAARVRPAAAIALHPQAHDAWGHVVAVGVELGATTAATGFVWGLMWPTGRDAISARQWLVAATVLSPVVALAGVKALRHATLQAGVQPLPAKQVVPCLVLAAAAGLGCGQTAGNVIGSLIGLLGFD